MLALLNFVWTVFNLVFRGHVLKVFWVWFLITLFPNLPVITTVEAIGLFYLMNVLKINSTLTSKQIEDAAPGSDAKYSYNVVGLLNNFGISFALGFLLLGGWVLHHFFM